jgi:hypothetical protein
VPPPTVILENVIRSFKKEADEDEAYAEEEEAADDEENQVGLMLRLLCT